MKEFAPSGFLQMKEFTPKICRFISFKSDLFQNIGGSKSVSIFLVCSNTSLFGNVPAKEVLGIL